MSGTSWELKYLLEQFYMQFEKSCCIQLDFHSRSIIVQTNIFGGGSHYITTSYISQFCFFSKAKAERAFSGRRWAWEQGALAHTRATNVKRQMGSIPWTGMALKGYMM
jgi:hypothetical protein